MSFDLWRPLLGSQCLGEVEQHQDMGTCTQIIKFYWGLESWSKLLDKEWLNYCLTFYCPLLSTLQPLLSPALSLSSLPPSVYYTHYKSPFIQNPVFLLPSPSPLLFNHSYPYLLLSSAPLSLLLLFNHIPEPCLSTALQDGADYPRQTHQYVCIL